MGLDGLRYANGTVWFTNVSKNTLHKVAVDATGAKTATISTIWSNTFSDDLWVGPDGAAYVATGSAGKIQRMARSARLLQSQAPPLLFLGELRRTRTRCTLRRVMV